VPVVDRSDEAAQEVAHASSQIRVWRLDHEMEVIAEEAVAQTVPPAMPDRSREQIDEHLPVTVVVDDRLSSVTAGGDMEDSSRRFDAPRARHIPDSGHAAGTRPRNPGAWHLSCASAVPGTFLAQVRGLARFLRKRGAWHVSGNERELLLARARPGRHRAI
jgi:hypothetical protein